MFPNPNCYRLRQLAKESKEEVNEICKDKFESLSRRLKKYVDTVSLDSHPSANGIMGKFIIAMLHNNVLIETLRTFVTYMYIYTHVMNVIRQYN